VSPFCPVGPVSPLAPVNPVGPRLRDFHISVPVGPSDCDAAVKTYPGCAVPDVIRKFPVIKIVDPVPPNVKLVPVPPNVTLVAVCPNVITPLVISRAESKRRTMIDVLYNKKDNFLKKIIKV
jgi:hypothetical protein